MAKEMKFSTLARTKLFCGVEQTVAAIRTTLGPRGRNAIFKQDGKVIVTNDGVTVAKNIELEDPFEDIGCSLVKEASSKTNEDSGDGTTTASILLYALLEKGMKATDIGNDAMLVRDGMYRALELATGYIKGIAKKVSKKDEMKSVATISSQEEEIGDIVSEALDLVGKDGVVSIEESNSSKMSSEVVKGMKLGRGFSSPFFANQQTGKVEIENPVIIISDKKFSSANEIIPVLSKLVLAGNKNIVLFCQEISGDALTTLLVNKMKGVANIVAISLPTVGEYGTEILEDIAYLTGGKFIAEASTQHVIHNMDDKTLSECLGRAEKVRVSKNDTVIIGGKGGEKIQERINAIEKELSEEDDSFKAKKLLDRKAKLVGGVGVIRVGGTTQVELKERLYKVEDALNATKAAIEDGIVPGGGVSLIFAKFFLENEIKKADEKLILGMKIVSESLDAPMRQILMNGGVSDASKFIETLRESNSIELGFDFKSSVEPTLINCSESGIIDPVKVILSALSNAVSVSSSILTSEVAIVESVKNEEKKK